MIKANLILIRHNARHPETEPGATLPYPRSSPPGCFECFIGGIDILSRTDKTVTIEMNHMIRGIEEVGKGCVK